MMPRRAAVCLNEAVDEVHLISAIFGLLPVPRPSSLPRLMSRIICLFHIIVYFIVTFEIIYRFINFSGVLYSFSATISSMFNVFTSLLNSYMLWKGLETYEEILWSLKTLDFSLKCSKLKVIYRKSYFFPGWFGIMTFYFLISEFTCGVFDSLYPLLNISKFIGSLHFISGILLIIHSQIIIIRQALSSALRHTPRCEIPRRIISLVRNYSDIVTVCKLIDKLFSFSLFVIILSSFQALARSVYYLFCGPEMVRINMIFAVSMLALFVAGAISLPVLIADEAKEFNNILYQVMIMDKTGEISNNKNLRLHIAMKREIVFTACGFFALDYTLIHSMIGAATTYLVILMQFSQPEPSSASSAANATTRFANSSLAPT